MGGCHRTGQQCFPTKQRNKQIPVMFGECGIRTGRCDKSCSFVDVEEDIECECACAALEKDCIGENQKFEEDQCKCQCSDKAAEQKCISMGETWEDANCNCICHQKCSNGYKLSDNSCSCTIIPDSLMSSYQL